MSRLVSLIILSAGCDLVFLDPPPPPRTVEVSFTRRWTENDASFAPVLEEARVDPELTAARPDGSPLHVTRLATGTYELATDAEDDRYVLRTSTPFFTVAYEHTASALRLVENAAGRLPRTPVTLPTRLSLTVTGDSATFDMLHTTGLWTSTELSGTNFNWQRAVSLSGPLGLLDASRHDAFYVTNYLVIRTEGVRRMLANWSRGSTTLTDGGTTMHSAELMPAANNLCATITTDRARDLARLRTVAPAAWNRAGTHWSLHAIPAPELGAVGAILLGFDSSPVETMQVAFTNPFVGTTAMLVSTAATARLYTAPGANIPLQPAYSVQMFARPFVATETCTSATLASGLIGLPGTISVAEVALVADDTVVPHGALAVSWSVTSERIDLFSVVVYEVGVEGTTTVEHVRHILFTLENRATLPADVFTPGHSYYLAVQTHLGLPNARLGDFDTLEYPMGIARASSGVFRVE